ncbi:MAG: hypothetical protein KDB25_00070 [Leucobacter sp.]|nr:hypothetical protein [Leucobacter sp.]
MSTNPPDAGPPEQPQDPLTQPAQPPQPDPQQPTQPDPQQPAQPAWPQPDPQQPQVPPPAAAPPPGQIPPPGYAPPQYAPQYTPPYPPVPPYQPPQQQPQGGKIWLGILIAVGAPILTLILSLIFDPYSGMGLIVAGVLAFGILVAAIVLTSMAHTRRTGIGMWIGLAALPFIFFGVCTALLVGSGF